MKIILFVLLLTVPLAHAGLEGSPGIFVCGPPPPGGDVDWCADQVGLSNTVAQVVNGTHPYLIGYASGRAMVSTHLSVLIWSPFDLLMFSTDAVTTVLTGPSGQITVSSYASKQNSPVSSSQRVSYVYWKRNPFGNGVTVTQKSKHAPGNYIYALGGFFPGWFYPWYYTTGPITKL